MSRRIVSSLSACLAVGALSVSGCGEGGSADGTDTANATGISATNSEDGTGDGNTDTNSNSGGPTSNTDTGDGDGDPGDGDTDTNEGDGDADSGEDGPKFDIHSIPDGEIDCQCGTTLDFSYIWIANSTQSTVTKLNTETMEEEGRYLTRADGAGSPSRTSVALSGRAVAVANRNGGVVKVFSQHEDCDPNKNGVPGLQTSNDLNYLPWGEDDCIDWFVPFDYTTQRPVAWAPGILNQGTCLYTDEQLWTAGCKPGQDAVVKVSLIDGDTGEIEFTVDVPGFECSSLSPYGGAVNAEGDFWFTNLVPGNDRLGFVDRETAETQVWNMPITPYGMTVDHDGNPWVASWSASQQASAAKFDVDTETWSYANNHVVHSLSGIQEDADGRMWMNYWQYDGQNLGTGGLVYIDMETMEVSEPFDLGCQSSTCRGMSVDLNGMIWSTSMASNTAFRFNPDTLEIDTYSQLVGPYTYSDMTGWGIQSATCGPQG
ncbi:Virginiamycin B lyase [Enhygromyxa salina]|uniref:Virginiamycin B lyase n=1 Tax=Enhygromyxa salina TaxID=215803 RepID=A0A2S9XAX7_9BACT|nr:hypothetical protein [Enhygromyxa salina]PRP90003.1 Virginiamycin B lyase [Enhygromyxa salina]